MLIVASPILRSGRPQNRQGEATELLSDLSLTYFIPGMWNRGLSKNMTTYCLSAMRKTAQLMCLKGAESANDNVLHDLSLILWRPTEDVDHDQPQP